MERQQQPNEQHHHHHHPSLSSYFTTNPPPSTAAGPPPPPTNGLLQQQPSAVAGDGPHMVYPHSVPSSAAVTSPLMEKRKRGRPRKYVTSEQALAAKKTAASSSKERRDSATSSSSMGFPKKPQPQLPSIGNAGQGFIPHIIDVVAGEDVGQKIMHFKQQSKREICIMSASGSVSNASLRQPATSGGSITYEGRLDLISLSGSFVNTEHGGMTGGLSVCLCSSEGGQIIGGAVSGPLKAAGPVQVIVGSFLIDPKKDVGSGSKGEASGGNVMHSPPGGGPGSSSGGYHPTLDNSARNNPMRGGNEDVTIGISNFMMQSRGMHMAPSRPMEWRGVDLSNPPGYEFPGVHSHSPNGSFSSFPSS